MFTKFLHRASTKEGKTVAERTEGAKTIYQVTRTSRRRVNTYNWENRRKIRTSMSLALETDFCEEKRVVAPSERITTSKIVETLILTGLHQGVWIKAEVLRLK